MFLYLFLVLQCFAIQGKTPRSEMPKSNKTPVRKNSKVSIKKTLRRAVRKSVPLRIVPPRHLIKEIWETRSVEQLEQDKKVQRTYCRNRTFNVKSATTRGQEYGVVCDSNGNWTCTCGDFVYRSSKNRSHYGYYCKHIAKSIDTVLDKTGK